MSTVHRGFDFFHPNVCQVCKISSKQLALKRCSQCHMIAYCGPKHQKKHWRHHKEICTVLHYVINMDALKSIAKMNLERLKFRSIIVGFCEQKLGRKLNFIEMNMIHFQRTCSVCDNTENLTDCELCLSDSYCPEHVDVRSEHLVGDCEDLQLCLEIRVFKTKNQEFLDYALSKKFRHDYSDMTSFITQNVVPDTRLSIVTRALVSDVLTRPLTLLYALSALGYTWPETLVVHILGSNSFETASVQSWDLLLKARPIRHLELHFIGPETTPPDETTNDITAFSTTKLYHEVGGRGRKKPSVICAFNCGIHEYEGEPNDTWGPSLGAILAQRVPIVLTSYTVSEATLDVRRLRELNPGLRVLQVSNPYADLSPLRDIESLGVYFVNSVLSILKPSEASL